MELKSLSDPGHLDRQTIVESRIYPILRIEPIGPPRVERRPTAPQLEHDLHQMVKRDYHGLYVESYNR